MAEATRSYAVNTYSYTLGYPAADCLRHLADLGYREFELMMYPGHCWPADVDAGARRRLAALLRERELRILTLNMPNVDLNVAAAAPEMRRHTRGILRGVVELAGDLGVPGVIIGPGKPNPLLPAPRAQLLGYFHEALDELAPLASRAGTRLLVENMPFAFLPDADGLARAVEAYGSREIGFVYDLANAFFVREDLGEGLRRLRDRLALIHVSDTGLAAYRHDAVGLGAVPFARVPPVLEEVRYRQPVMLEIISADPDRDIRESIQRLAAMGWPGPA
jgi:sugar phosphate isomerase/epimerase